MRMEQCECLSLVLPQSWWFPFRCFYQREDKTCLNHRPNLNYRGLDVKLSLHSNNDLLSIATFYPGRFQWCTKLCLCLQDLTQGKAAGPSGVEVCCCLKNAQQYQAVQRGRGFQAEVGAAFYTWDILTLQKVWLQRYSRVPASQRNLSGSTFIIWLDLPVSCLWKAVR